MTLGIKEIQIQGKYIFGTLCAPYKYAINQRTLIFLRNYEILLRTFHPGLRKEANFSRYHLVFRKFLPIISINFLATSGNYF